MSTEYQQRTKAMCDIANQRNSLGHLALTGALTTAAIHSGTAGYITLGFLAVITFIRWIHMKG